MGVKKKYADLPPRPSLPRRCKKVTRTCPGLVEEREGSWECLSCGYVVALRDPTFAPTKNKSIKCTPVTKSEIPGDADVDCAVCMNCNNYKRMFRLLCNHRFHKRCILKWFKVDKRCPLCRK